MAFNPFHKFRKHRRAMFAVLTIICMFTFVLSFGAGDFFGSVGQAVSGRSRYPEVARLNGKKVDLNEIVRLRTQRQVANTYMIYAVMSAHENIINEITTKIKDYDEPAQRQLQQIITSRMYAMQLRQFEQFVQEYQQRFGFFINSLDYLYDSLKKSNKNVEADRIGLLRNVLEQDQWMLRRPKDDLYQNPDYDLYFGGSLTGEGLLDWLLWRNEADRLGIELTKEDVVREIGRESLNRLSSENSLMIEERLASQFHGAKKVLISSLTDEFRVRLAQAAVLGFDPGGYTQVPAYITPDEFWAYFRKNRTELNLAVLPIPISKFVAEVKEKPTEEELKALFDKHKEEEYAPFKETPGFKQPRRVKVEWIEASPESKHYQQEAQKFLTAAIVSTTSNPWLGVSLAQKLTKEYEYSTSFGNLRIAPWTEADFARNFYTYASQQRPETAASIVAQAAANAASAGNPFALVVSEQAMAAAREAKSMAPAVAKEAGDRIPMALAFLGSAVAPAPVLTISGLWHYAEKKDVYLPMEVVQGKLIAKLKEELARELVTSSVDAFKKELEEKKGQPADSVKLIEKYVKQNNWERGGSKDVRDMWELAGDPDLAKLKEAYVSRNFEDSRAKQFAIRHFFGTRSDKPKVYTPEDLQSEKATYVYWKTADESALTLTFDKAKPAVERAWVLTKARELAKQEADKVAQQAVGDPTPVLTDAGKKLGTAVFDLPGVAYLKGSTQVLAGRGGQFEPYRIPEDKIEFPPLDFVTTAMTLQKGGETTVVADYPKNNFYVVALRQRSEPTVKDFHRDTSPSAILRQNFLLTRLEQEHRVQYRAAVLEQLRQKAGLTINQEALKDTSDRDTGE